MRPERIWEVRVAGVDTDFPPLRSLERHATNLPLQTTSLIGREEAIARVVALLGEDHIRQLTLTGPGGTGKTRLALAAASELLDEFPDGVWFVDLAPLADPNLVLPTIAATLGVREAGGRSLADALCGYLAPKSLLLVLDNYERLLDAATVVSDLLQAGAGVKALVTSREPLRLHTEWEFPVAPLVLPEEGARDLVALARVPTIALFIARAQAVRPEFALTPANAAAVAAICRRLDGLPLAIELAAAQVRHLPPQALLSRLERALPLLTGGPRDAPARQRTLRDTIAWSHELLPAQEQTLFRRFGVFAGGWTLGAAEVVANPRRDLDLFSGLAVLIDKSLVRQREEIDGEPRFGMLETIREYALEQLAAAVETENVRQRHADYVLAMIEAAATQLWTGIDPDVLDRMQSDLDNVRGALDWLDRKGEIASCLRLAVGMGWFWMIRGLASEGRSWLERAAVQPGAVTPTIRAWALLWASPLAILQRDFATAVSLAEESISLWRQHDEISPGHAAALIAMGQAVGQLGDQARAAALLEEALVLARSLHDPFLIAFVLDNLAGLALLRGDAETATRLITEARALPLRPGEAWGEPYSLSLLAEIARRQGDYRQAIAHQRAAIAIANRRGDRIFVRGCLIAIGNIAAFRGDGERAARLLGAAERLGEAVGSWSHLSARSGDQQAIQAAREALGEEAFTAAWAAGRTLSLDQAVSEALAFAESEAISATAAGFSSAVVSPAGSPR
jgi:predicted ATPase